MGIPAWVLRETVVVTCVSIDSPRSMFLVEREAPRAGAFTVEFNAAGAVLVNGVAVELAEAQLTELAALGDATAANRHGTPEVGRPVRVPVNFNGGD